MIAKLLLAIVLTFQAAPATPVFAPVATAEDIDGQTVITLAVGKTSGVEIRWQGVLRDAHGVVLRGSNFLIFKIKQGIAYAKVNLPIADVKRAVDAILTPPAD